MHFKLLYVVKSNSVMYLLIGYKLENKEVDFQHLLNKINSLVCDGLQIGNFDLMVPASIFSYFYYNQNNLSTNQISL